MSGPATGTVTVRMLDRPAAPYVIEGLSAGQVADILGALKTAAPGYTALEMRDVTVHVNRAMISTIEER